VIVVIGSPSGRLEADQVRAAGRPSLAALAAAARGSSVQVVGRVGDDAAADAVLQDLARHGVGHVAILRDPSHATPMITAVPGEAGLALEAADVDLALRYLTDFAVLVVVDVDASVRPVIERAAAWGEAALIDPAALPGETDDAWAVRIGDIAAGLDAGSAAFRSGR
jgi:sugar/nucleoside kinase (ribokinase family)